MTRERLNQIRKAVGVDPSSAESYTGELIRAVDQYILDSHAQSGALRDAMAKAEQLRGALRPTGHNLKTCCCPDCCTLRQVTKERDAARAEAGRLRVENKFFRERPIPEGRIHQAMTGYVMDLRGLVLDHEWVTDGRECLVYCLWCKQSESNGHAETCEMFGPGGLIPIDPKTKRPAPVKSLRERGCQCQWEEGDSPCRVHGEEET